MRAGWTRTPPRNGRMKGATFIHEASGWIVAHCGGTCAIWPYGLRDPANPNDVTVTGNGKGFNRLPLAMDAVEGLLAGTWRTSNERCTPGTRVLVPIPPA